MFVYPPSEEEMRCRLIRQRPDVETDQSIIQKCNQMSAQVREVKDLSWINASMDSGGSEQDFLKRAAPHIIFEVYKFK